MKKIETILSKHGNIDKKNKVNRSKKIISKSIIDTIEKGISIEQLDELSKEVKIFKYQTQITIHGTFPELSSGYVGGYKSLILNKNKSLGIKWNAIDSKKRKRIAEDLQYVGFYFKNTSTETTYSISKLIDENNFTEVLAEMKKIANKINLDLIFGGINLYAVSAWGQKRLILELNINGIYEKNIEKFIEPFKKEIEINRNLKNIEHEKIKKKYEQEEIDSKIKQQSEIDKYQKEIDYFKSLEIITEPETGVYLSLGFDYKDNLTFTIRNLYKEPRQKKFRKSTETFSKLEDALSFAKEPKKGYSDSIVSARFKGRKLILN